MNANPPSLESLAARSGGILLTERAVAAGWPESRLRYRLRRGGWHPAQHGVWLHPQLRPDLRVRLRAAQLRHPQLVASHRSAAALWGFDLLNEGREEHAEVELTCRAGRRLVLREARVHRLRLGEDEVAVREGLRLTAPVRTVADLLRSLPLHEAVIAADSAFRQGAACVPQVFAALRADSRRSRTADARRALEQCDPASGSAADSKARLEMRGAGLFPESQVEVVTPSGRLYRLDFLFRREGLAVEIEGHRWHGTRLAHRRDAARFNDLARCPAVRRVLRFTADDVFHRPRQMIRTVRRTLSALPPTH